MKIIRVRSRKEGRYFVLPSGLREKVALYMRGWRPADLTHVPVDWWVNPKLPKTWGRA